MMHSCACRLIDSLMYPGEITLRDGGKRNSSDKPYAFIEIVYKTIMRMVSLPAATCAGIDSHIIKIQATMQIKRHLLPVSVLCIEYAIALMDSGIVVFVALYRGAHNHCTL
jgi:hypothetical protein